MHCLQANDKEAADEDDLEGTDFDELDDEEEGTPSPAACPPSLRIPVSFLKR